MQLWLVRPVVLRISCRCVSITAVGGEGCTWRSPALLPGPSGSLLRHGFHSGRRSARLFAPQAKFWSRERLPFDADSPDPWGNDSDVEDDYRCLSALHPAC